MRREILHTIAKEQPAACAIVHPIFGIHAAGKESVQLWELFDAAYRRGEVLEISAWPRQTSSKLLELKPQIVAVDCLSGLSDLQSLFFSAPANPYTLRELNGQRDIFFVGADVEMSWVNFDEYPYALLRSYWKDISHGDIDDPNLTKLASKLKAILLQSPVTETVVLLALHAAGSYISGGDATIRSLTMTLLGMNALRMYADIGIPAGSKLKRLGRPIFFPVEDLDVRNALMALKLHEVSQSLMPSTDNIDTAVVVGYSHGYGQNVWNNHKRQENIVRESVVKAVRKIKQDMGANILDGGSENLAQALDALAWFLGGTAIWRVKERPEKLSVDSLERSIVQEAQFVSPMISQMIVEEAQKVWS